MSFMNYNSLSEITKKYVDNSVTLYSFIKNKNITINAKGKDYSLNMTDKKVISLFIAGIFSSGNLHAIFSEYPEFNLMRSLEFISLSENDMNQKNNIEEIYSKEFFAFILVAFVRKYENSGLLEVTPESILLAVMAVENTDSKILEYYCDTLDINGSHVFTDKHPLCVELLKCIKNKEIIHKRENIPSFLKNNIGEEELMLELFDNQMKYTSTSEKNNDKTEEAVFKLKTNDLDTMWNILDNIKKKFIGQENVCESLFYNIVNNQQLVEMGDIPDGQRSIIFLDGSTGTGKTAIIRDITKELGIPFVASTVTNYSSTGYSGSDLTDILEDLYEASGKNIGLAEKGIVVLDEFDKIVSSGDRSLEMKKAVQQQLLDFIGGGKYTISNGGKGMYKDSIKFDTSKLTFVCLGALTELRESKMNPEHSIGFGEEINKKIETYEITPQDLINIGLERELVGRLNCYLHTNDYNVEIFERILRESPISPLAGFVQMVETRNQKITIDDDVYKYIANEAFSLNMGARSLQIIVNSIRSFFLKDILRNPQNSIHIDVKTISEILANNVNRKGRG